MTGAEADGGGPDRVVVESYWDKEGPVLVADGGGRLPVAPGRAFRWHVGDVVAPPPDPPPYVFEPRPLLEVQEALAATPEGGLDHERLQAELRFSDRPHVVYAAFYGILPKVGMTSSQRLRDRLREQGADAGFVLQECRDRAEARATEKAVARLYGLPEWRRAGEILRQLTRPVEWDRILARADDLRTRVQGAYEPWPETLRIDEVPLEQPLPAPPQRVPVEGDHEGTWLGGKGNFLFYRAASAGPLDVGSPPVHALRRQDLVGRVIRVGDAPRTP